jgi:hypothetical protein
MPITTFIWILIAITTINNFEVHQINIKITFLNCDIDEEVYIKQLEGFVINRQEKKVYKFIKSLHELKQILNQWHEIFL